jgi:dTDP-4-amino-4,6-dideoxygalactose transaminase
MLRQYGWTEKYLCGLPGGRNSRLDELQAAILRAKLPHLDDWNLKRRSIAKSYNTAFRQLPLEVPYCEDTSYVGHLYVIRTGNRRRIQDRLKEAGIGTDVHYPIPDHLQPGIQPLLSRTGPLPVTERSCEQVLTLPCFPELTSEEQRSVIAQVLEAVR